MNNKGVITGDIINSTSIQTEWKKLLIDTIKEIVNQLQSLSPLKLEFFRGDSFQLVVEKPQEALRIAILLRAGLQSRTPLKSKQKWDARIAIGIGEIEYTAQQVVVSDGEAFHFSGWEFDVLGKKKLAIRTPWKEANNELKVSTAFADDIISGWSIPQAETIYLALSGSISQKEIAEKLGKSAQNISKLLSAGKEALIQLYLKRYVQLIKRNER